MPVSDDQATVHVVDDDEQVRRSIAFLLEAVGYRVAIYGSAAELLESADSLARGCVVTDVKMPGMSGLELQEALRQRRPDLPMILMTGHGDVAMAVRGMRAGAIDFIEKPFQNDELISAVQAALARVADESAGRREMAAIADRLKTLTPREREVMDGLINGKLNKQIAHELGISQRTVEVHRAAVIDKMGVDSLAMLVRMALVAGILEPLRTMSAIVGAGGLTSG